MAQFLRGFAPLFQPENLRFLAQGFAVTLEIAVWTIAASLAVGTLLGIARYGGDTVRAHARGAWFVKVVGAVAALYIEIFRNLPMLLVMLAARFLTGLHPIPAAIAGMSIYTAAVMAENVRAGLAATPRGQWEAAASQGLSYAQTLRHVVLPQGFRKVIPPTVGQFITVVKDTAYAWALGIQEVTGSGTIIFAKYADPMQTYIVIAAMYFVTNFAMALAARALERRLAVRGS